MKRSEVYRGFVSASLVLISMSLAFGQRIFTVAGGYVGDGKPATSAALSSPLNAAFDSNDNLYVSDSDNCRIRKVDSAGTITTVAGTGICGFSGDGGPATRAKLSYPTGLAIDPKGEIFFSDSENSRIRRIDPNGTITTVAGKGKVGYCGDGGSALKACFDYPTELTLGGRAPNEILYIADSINARIRRVVLTTGTITTVAGNGHAGYSGDGGPAKQASICFPNGLAVKDASHSLWISDPCFGVIRQVDTKTGIISTFAKGSGSCNLELCSPLGIALDRQGNLHVADVNWVLRITVPDGTVTVDAGTNEPGFSGDGHPANVSLLNSPTDVTLDSADNLFIVDRGNNRVRKGAGPQDITTVAGGAINDGRMATSASLNWPAQTVFDQAGNLYIADEYNARVRKVSPAGKISTFAGTGITGYSGDGGKAKKATLGEPTGIAVDHKGNVFIADTLALAIRKVDKTGTISTFVWNEFGTFTLLNSLAIDKDGNVLATDLCSIWKITPTLEVTSIAGVPGDCGYNGDDIPAYNALLDTPFGLALDSQNNLYIADTYNSRIRMVDSQGIIHTVAGIGTCGFSGDGGLATNAMICDPWDVGVDRQGNLFIADSDNNRIRHVDKSGTIETIAGTGHFEFNGDGRPALQTSMYPLSITVDPSGQVYLTDFSSFRVRTIK